MYCIFILCGFITLCHCANYQRYDQTQYQTTSRYPSYSYSTSSNQYNQYPSNNYGNDIASFPVTRYPNYNSGYSSTYNSYGSNGYQSYTTPSYGRSNTQQYGNGYGRGYGQGYSPYESPFMRDNEGNYCVDRSPQTGIWVDSLMGMWYGVEVVQHLAGDSRLDYTRSCIVIHIREPKEGPPSEYQEHHVQHINAVFRQEYRHIRLLWDEAGQTIEYALYFRNDSAGYWQVLDGQNGTLTSRSNYQQFSGSVQVLKAVNDHLVLSFCQEGTSGRQPQLYSVLFSRDPGAMARWEVDSVHTLLQNKKLSVASRRMVCGNSAQRMYYSAAVPLMMCLLAMLLRT